MDSHKISSQGADGRHKRALRRDQHALPAWQGARELTDYFLVMPGIWAWVV